jgi:hypothetical protein
MHALKAIISSYAETKSLSQIDIAHNLSGISYKTGYKLDVSVSLNNHLGKQKNEKLENISII